MKLMKLFGSLFAVTLFFALSAPSAHANGRLIDNNIFDKVNSMTEQDIRNFINSRPSSCLAASGAIFPEPITYFQYGGNVDAARVIYNAARYSDVNPQVILTTLQKEQSLITRTNCFEQSGIDSRNKAMGMGCPDSGPCPAPAYAGFHQQVMKGTWQLGFNRQRAEGNISWGGNDNISYGGYMTRGNFKRCASCQTIFYDGYGIVDGQSVLMENGATASLYTYTPHLGQSFPSIFTVWFGNLFAPSIITNPSRTAHYYYLGTGIKIAIPNLAMSHDYGHDPQFATVYSQELLDQIPGPDPASGISSSLSHIIKSNSDTDIDGAALYLMTLGKRHQIMSMQQFADFGFNEADIAYLPASFVFNLDGGAPLSNFIFTPTSNVFRAAGAEKRLIFDYTTYKSLNPGDAITPFSYFLADSIASGAPLSNRDILVRTTAGAISLFKNNSYNLIGSMDAHSCWGFDGNQGTPLYQLPNDNYVAPIIYSSTLGCTASDASGNSYLLNNVNKLIIPASYGFAAAPFLNANAQANLERLPTVTEPLKRAIKANNSPAVWYLEDGVKKIISTYRNFQLLGLENSPLHILTPAGLKTFAASGIKLGDGALVKSTNSPLVYVAHGSSRTQYATSNDLLAYGNNWNQLEVYPEAALDQYYPSSGKTVNKYLYQQSSGKFFLMDINGCYQMSNALMADYGQSPSTTISNQSYSSDIFKGAQVHLCRTGSNYARKSGESLVYWIKDGAKRPFNTWARLVDHSGTTSPAIQVVSPSVIDSLTTGPQM